MKALLVSIALVVCICLAGPVLAKGKGGHGLHGKVVSVDSTSIVVQTHGKDGKQTVTVTTDANTSVTIDGKPSQVGELKAGLFVHITPENGTAAMITASTSRPHHHLGTRKNKNAPVPTTNPAGSVAG